MLHSEISAGALVSVCPVPAPPCSADIGIVLMMVVPGLDVVGETPRMVDLAAVDPACAVAICFPSAEVTSFRMVPAGRPALV